MKTKKELYINGFTNKIDILTSIKETIQEGSYVYAEDMLKKYTVKTVLHMKLNTTSICNLTVLGNALKSLWLSSNRIVAVSIAQFLNLLHHPQSSIFTILLPKKFLELVDTC